jgi:phytoene dehydrogenase-like protein
MQKLIIIGAGISGLATGCFARMNGFDTKIFEMHDIPGGVCTSWKRSGFLFDHCLHWVLGSGSASTLKPVFQELGVTDCVTFYYPEIFRHIEANGKALDIYTDIDKLCAELTAVFPADKRAIRKFINLVRFYTGFRPPLDADFGALGFKAFIRILPFIPSFLKLKATTIEQFLTKLFSPEMREMLFRMFPVKGMPALMAVMPLAFFHNREGGYPLGGSLNFARVIERKYKSLGGLVEYDKRVVRILVEQDRAIGIETDTGEKEYGDIIVSCADGRTTIFDMLQGAYTTAEIRRAYEKPNLWPPLISISLGIDKDFSGYAEINDFKLESPALIAGKSVEWLGFFHYSHDPAFAPKGKSVIEIQIETDYQYWENLSRDRKAYQDEKDKILALCIDILDKKLGGIKSSIEATDVATPVTWERYTGNWRGSYEGWMPTKENFGKFFPRTLPGLESFYMIGQWVFPGGGVPQCMAQGKRLIQQILKKNHRH